MEKNYGFARAVFFSGMKKLNNNILPSDKGKSYMKKLIITYFSRDRNIPPGIYALKEPNIYYPVIYFRLPKKIHNKKVLKHVMDHLGIKKI
jgi:hypothetical protein